mmetsp:Transcript_25226/g.38534  ORF Transcript_25226/g.38534 Transcript_25226/m.38534 type:complete len:311 (+) Transcript_25226:172-1104(+)
MKFYAAFSLTLLSTANAAFSISTATTTKPAPSTVTVTGLHGQPATSHAEDLALTISLSLAHFSALDNDGAMAMAITEEVTEEIETALQNHAAKETVEKCERMIQSIEEDMVVIEEPNNVAPGVSGVVAVDVEVAEEREDIVIVTIEEEETMLVVEVEEEPVVEDVVAEEIVVEETEPVIVVPARECEWYFAQWAVPVPVPVTATTTIPKMEVKPRTRRHIQIQQSTTTKSSKESSKKMRLFSITNNNGGRGSGQSSSSMTKINSVVKVSPGYSYVSTPTFNEKNYNSKTGKAMAGMSRFVKLFSAFGLRR